MAVSLLDTARACASLREMACRAAKGAVWTAAETIAEPGLATGDTLVVCRGTLGLLSPRRSDR